jgi:hypothetical protein
MTHSGPSASETFRVIATRNNGHAPLEVEIGVFTERELIKAIAALVQALAEIHD